MNAESAEFLFKEGFRNEAEEGVFEIFSLLPLVGERKFSVYF
jgi:hypothetical protein